MHGGTNWLVWPVNRQRGLSPHARGNLLRPDGRYDTSGPIPACTGEPDKQRCRQAAAGAYPRMHGGTGYVKVRVHAAEGLSPYARGNRRSFLHAHRVAGPIPACTGEPLTGESCLTTPRAYPRMHGGTRQHSQLWRLNWGLSPHARGNRGRCRDQSPPCGPIPACTGEPKPDCFIALLRRAYPRMHGGTVRPQPVNTA